MSSNYPPPPPGPYQYPQPGPPPPPGAYQYPQQGPPLKKKTSPWVWVAVGVGAFLMLIVLVAVVGGFLVWNKVKQAGLDPALMRSNPALAVSKLIAATNPDIEVLGVDERKGIIRVREKSTGKIMTVNFEDAKRGKFVFQEEGKDALTIQASEGSDVKTPDWAPVYPGAKVEGTVNLQSGEGEGGSFHFTTKDPPDKVRDYYSAALKSGGMKVTSNATEEGGGVTGAMVMGEDEARRRNVMVTIGKGGEGTTVNVVFSTKS